MIKLLTGTVKGKKIKIKRCCKCMCVYVRIFMCCAWVCNSSVVEAVAVIIVAIVVIMVV